MPTVIDGSTGVTMPAGGVANTAGAAVGTTDTQTLTNKTLTSPTLTTPNINSAQFATVEGTAPIYPCRAWVNFDGTRDSTGAASTANTNRFIRASGNVTSVLRNGAGDYTVTFTNAMVDANYAFTLSIQRASGVAGLSQYVSNSTTSYRFITTNTTPTNTDFEFINVAIFR